MGEKLNIAFFGSSLVSSYWNGAATYYRGIVRALADLGHRVTFYEPDILDRQKHRDMADPPWAKVVVYRAESADDAIHAVLAARDADVVIKASGVGAFDDVLDREVLELQSSDTVVAFWDVDAPATLARVRDQPGDAFGKLIPRYDCILTYGGGEPVVQAYMALGAQRCVPIYNALDPSTHYPVATDPRYWCDLVFLGNRLPDRERRVEEFFLIVAECLPDRVFVLGGNGWEGRTLPKNVIRLGHVPTKEHNALNSSATAVLNISRDSMASTGFSPATRVFEAAGAAACIITDQWDGIEMFLDPGGEVLVARNGEEVVNHLERLHREDAEMIGAAARRLILGEHTYCRRALETAEVFESLRSARRVSARETVRR